MNRQFKTSLVLSQGLALGLVAFAIAELSLSHSTFDSTNHDMMLAQRLGLIYTPAVGAWLGWLQRSRSRILVGIGVGLIIGAIYYVLCAGQNFLAIMVGFPMLLGGGLVSPPPPTTIRTVSETPLPPALSAATADSNAPCAVFIC